MTQRSLSTVDVRFTVSGPSGRQYTLSLRARRPAAPESATNPWAQVAQQTITSDGSVLLLSAQIPDVFLLVAGSAAAGTRGGNVEFMVLVQDAQQGSKTSPTKALWLYGTPSPAFIVAAAVSPSQIVLRWSSAPDPVVSQQLTG